MKLRDLFSDDATIDPQAEATVVSGLAADSRVVKPGDVFFALAGSKTDGARFIDSAIAAGAVAVVGDHPPQGLGQVPFVRTPNPRRALALAAAKFFPRQPQTIAAVTGTSGKTSVAAFTRQIWQRLGHASASIGTIGLVSPKRAIYGSLTTPDPIALHRQLDEIAGDGVTHLAFEASSHGLDQYRLDGVRIAAGGFTNLTRDHMDYHPDVAHYLAAKLRLFRDLVMADGAAVISADHDCSQAVIDAARARGLRIMTVGSKGDGAGEGIRLVEGTGTRSGCRWSANSRSRMRWCPRASRSAPAACRIGSSKHSNISREQKAGWSGSPSATAHRSLSTMRTSPMRWRRRCRRCGHMRNESSSSCSAPAAIAMPASVP
jgi:UDP-N-acetylmuramoyl-L-alanyl-D-glutamate--2,6-diaminopimelate ligase